MAKKPAVKIPWNKTYPWDKWFSQAKFTIVKGVDFVCMTHSMIVQVRTAAMARGKSVSIKVNDSDVTKLIVTVN